jgi:hypothetical protein
MAAPATARNATAGARLPMQRWLFDVKTIFGGNGLYQCPRARDEQSGAVAERAHRCSAMVGVASTGTPSAAVALVRGRVRI